MVMITVTGCSRQVVGSQPTQTAVRQETSDEALIKAIADGDRRAMQTLFQRHHVRVYRFVQRLTNDASVAEDLVSDVFMDVWRQADGFKAQSQVSTWLMSIARHKALSALRRRPDEQLDEHMAAAIEDPADGPEAIMRNDAARSCRLACRSFPRCTGR
jgi:RNA polymerase sigma-70 factor, ECF subfamily